MTQPLVVSIPHKLGREEATRRLRGGLGRLRATFGDTVRPVQETWTGDHLDFRWSVFGQTASGALDVEDDHVRVEIQLPWLLARLAGKAKSVLARQGQILLEKK
jgi:hypothetical protein